MDDDRLDVVLEKPLLSKLYLMIRVRLGHYNLYRLLAQQRSPYWRRLALTGDVGITLTNRCLGRRSGGRDLDCLATSGVVGPLG